jgi:hypothetical protein
MHTADATRCKDTNACEACDRDRCRNSGNASSLRRHRDREIALGELLFGGEDERFVVWLDARPEFTVDDSGDGRDCTSRTNRRVNTIKARTVVGGGEAHL